MTKTTEDIRRSMHKNLIFDKLSPNMMYAQIITKAEFRAIIAPTMPPFIPAERVALKATVAAYAPMYSRTPPIIIHTSRVLSVITTSP